MSAQVRPKKIIDSFTDGPLLHLLEQHSDFKATMEGRRRGLRIAAITLVAVYVVYLVVVIITVFVGAHNVEPLDAAVELLTVIMLVYTVIFLALNYAYITRPQARYAKALAEAHPGLDLDDEGSIQAFVWEREGHPDSLLPGLYNWLVWKSKLMREEQTIMGVDAIVKHALSPAEQMVLDVWGFNDINAEVFEFGVHANPVGDVERIARGIASFRAIGADKAADIWAQALLLLEKVGGAVRSMHQMEGEIYDQLGELNEQLYELEPETHALLYDYVMEHKAEFVSEQAFGKESETRA